MLTAALLTSADAQSGVRTDLAQAMRMVSQGDLAGAERKLREVEKVRPEVFEVQYRLGLVLLRQGKHREASTRLEAAVRQAPSSAPAWMAVAQVRMHLGKREESVAAANRAAALVPPEPMMWRGLSRIFAEAGEFRRALELEENATAGNGETAESHRLRGLVYRSEGKPAEAVNSLQEAIRLAPESWPPYAALAGLFLDHRTPEPVVALLQAAPKTFAKIAEYHRILGLAYYQTGKRDLAIDEFLAVADLEPDAEIGYTSLETILPHAGPRRGELMRRFERFQAKQPKNPIGHFLVARVLALDGAPAARVEPLLRRAIFVEPRFWPAYFELGLLLETQGNQAEAVRMLERTVKLKGDYAAAYFALSRLYGQQGNRVQAVASRKKHAELIEAERLNAEKGRELNPALNYRLEAGPGMTSPPKER